LIDITAAVYLVSSVHAKTGKVLCEIFSKPLVRPSLCTKNLQYKHMCLHTRVSSPGSFCNCSCPAVRARPQRLHMSRPSSVWLALKHLEWFDCVAGCTGHKRGHRRGNGEITKNISQYQSTSEN